MDLKISRKEETGLPPASESRILTNDRDWGLSDKQSCRGVAAQRVSLQLVQKTSACGRPSAAWPVSEHSTLPVHGARISFRVFWEFLGWTYWLVLS